MVVQENKLKERQHERQKHEHACDEVVIDERESVVVHQHVEEVGVVQLLDEIVEHACVVFQSLQQPQ